MSFKAALDLPSDHMNYLFNKEHTSVATKHQTRSCAIRFLKWVSKLDDDTPLIHAHADRTAQLSHSILRGITGEEFTSVVSKTWKRRKKVTKIP